MFSSHKIKIPVRAGERRRKLVRLGRGQANPIMEQVRKVITEADQSLILMVRG